MQAPEEHPDLLLDAADGVVDIFLSSVNKAEVADVLDRAVKMSSTKVIVVIVNGDAPDVKWEAPEDWSCIQQEVLCGVGQSMRGTPSFSSDFRSIHCFRASRDSFSYRGVSSCLSFD